MSEETERVKMWNTFFKLAWSGAKTLYETSGKQSATKFDPVLGGILPAEELHTIAALVLCNLAIEARVNHLIEELAEKKRIDDKAAKAALWLSTEDKWFLLPLLAKRRRRFDSGKDPHQAITIICQWRNNLVHVKYGPLQKKKLPSCDEMLRLFKQSGLTLGSHM